MITLTGNIIVLLNKGKEVIIMGELIYNGGIVVAILVIFMVGLAFKMMYTLCYSEVLDKIECRNFRQCKIISHIVEGFEAGNKEKINIKNTGAYVNNEINKWKKWGLYVERMNDYGNAAVSMCIIVGAIVDMYLISNYDSGNLQVSEVVIKVSVYSFIPAICFTIIKLWDHIMGIEYKKRVIYEEIVNYIDNREAYVSLNTDKDVIEKIINEDNNSDDSKNNINNNINKEVKDAESIKNDVKQVDNKEDNTDLKENEKVEVISQVLNEYL